MMLGDLLRETREQKKLSLEDAFLKKTGGNTID